MAVHSIAGTTDLDGNRLAVPRFSADHVPGGLDGFPVPSSTCQSYSRPLHSPASTQERATLRSPRNTAHRRLRRQGERRSGCVVKAHKPPQEAGRRIPHPAFQSPPHRRDLRPRAQRFVANREVLRHNPSMSSVPTALWAGISGANVRDDVTASVSRRSGVRSADIAHRSYGGRPQ